MTVFQPNQNCWAAIIFGQVELLSNKSNQWRSVRHLFGEGVLETSHDENMPLTVKKRRRKKRRRKKRRRKKRRIQKPLHLLHY